MCYTLHLNAIMNLPSFDFCYLSSLICLRNKSCSSQQNYKGKKMTKSYTVKCTARKQTLLKLPWLSTSLSGVRKRKFTGMCVYALPNLQHGGTFIKGYSCLLSKLSLLQQIIMQHWANRNAREGDSRSGWIGFSSARCSCQHGSNIGTVQISKEFWFVENLLETLWLVFVFQYCKITIGILFCFSFLFLSQPPPRSHHPRHV